MSGERVAVIGATGWVGRHVCAALAAHGHGVVALARSPAAHLSGYPFHPVDLTSVRPGALAGLLRSERVTAVVNATDAANARDGWHRPDAVVHEANTTAALTLVRAVRELADPPRLVHLGTLHEYGEQQWGGRVREEDPARPRGAYARSRLIASETVLASAGPGVPDPAVLRLANVCGPHPSPASFPGLLQRSFRRALAGERPSLRIAGDHRDYVDVRDVARAVVRACERGGGLVNIGGGRAVAVKDMVARMVEVSGVPADAVEQTPGDVGGFGGGWSLADVSAAERLLDWRPRIPVERSLHDMWHA
ncbi:NAD(P)-dependent oxidoreductase [Nocardiopsis sp. NPDC006139]|uniref:NAD-dependent epimerase/dehydratase family protein n=1 Tax=unclassified Nocardiopsis TaxID=2649073 RepID=UPI0033A43FA1